MRMRIISHLPLLQHLEIHRLQRRLVATCQSHPRYIVALVCGLFPTRGLETEALACGDAFEAGHGDEGGGEFGGDGVGGIAHAGVERRREVFRGGLFGGVFVEGLLEDCMVLVTVHLTDTCPLLYCVPFFVLTSMAPCSFLLDILKLRSL
jgi:hypothetical protein